MKINHPLFLCPSLFAVVAILPSGFPASGQNSTFGGVTPICLQCEYDSNATSVETEHPRLYWKLQGPGRGQRQTTYQILAASSADKLDHDEGNLWDTGKVDSEKTIQIGYDGKALESSQEIFWKVRVWDEDGKASNWSTNASWTMGLLRKEDWKGVWICAPAETEAMLLRKEFDVRPGLSRAIIHACGLGQYEMFLNGAKAGKDLLTPGWTDYDETAIYNTRDVTALLREGRNAIGLSLGNGMYRVVRRNRFAKFTGSFGPLRAIVHLRLEYQDGSTEFVGTDSSWRINPGPITYSSIYGGEDFDARRLPVGWDQPDFDDSDWANAVAIVRPADTLRGHSASALPIQAIEMRKPVHVQPIEPGVAVYDLGQNTSYMPRLRVSGPAGSTVRLTPAEIVFPDGNIDRRTMGSTNRGISWWQYTLRGNSTSEIRNPKLEIETWFPQFYYVGCRYLEARLMPAEDGGELPKIESLEGLVVHSIAEPIGEFECSNPLLNKIRELVRWAQRANMVSVLTDCPHREKLGWLEQYHLNGPAIRYEFDMGRMFTKGMQDMADAQLSNGLVPNIAPEYTVFNGAFRAATEWGSAFIIVPWQQYQFNGDIALLRQHYNRMKRYFAYLESKAENDIVSEGLGDWCDIGPARSNRAELTPPPVTASAFYYRDAWILSHVADALGHAEDAREFARKAEQIRASYNREFYHESNGTYATGSQCANALPLVFGIVEPEHREAVFGALVNDVKSRDYSMTAGDIGFRFLLQALAQGGRSDVIYRMINQDEKPGYGYQIKMGATSLTEFWDAKRTGSHDHFMLGHITEWFYKDLCGIDSDPAGPGFKKIIIKPTPVGDLGWAKASYSSIRGTIVSHWQREGSVFTLSVTIPPNTTATVFVPASAADQVTESGQPVSRNEHVRFLRMEEGRAVFAVESGDYEFASSTEMATQN